MSIQTSPGKNWTFPMCARGKMHPLTLTPTISTYVCMQPCMQATCHAHDPPTLAKGVMLALQYNCTPQNLQYGFGPGPSHKGMLLGSLGHGEIKHNNAGSIPKAVCCYFRRQASKSSKMFSLRATHSTQNQLPARPVNRHQTTSSNPLPQPCCGATLHIAHTIKSAPAIIHPLSAALRYVLLKRTALRGTLHTREAP